MGATLKSTTAEKVATSGAEKRLNKHMSYSELTGKDESPRHETTRAGKTEVPF